VFPVRYGQTFRVEMSFRQKTRRWIMPKIVIVILMSSLQTYRSYINRVCFNLLHYNINSELEACI
jgi:hypothetical protein